MEPPKPKGGLCAASERASEVQGWGSLRPLESRGLHHKPQMLGTERSLLGLGLF